MKMCINRLVQCGQLLVLGTLLLFIMGCPCPPCLQVKLPTEPHPTMSAEVETNAVGGLDEQELNDILEDLYQYQGALDKCNDIIIKYNSTIK